MWDARHEVPKAMNMAGSCTVYGEAKAHKGVDRD